MTEALGAGKSERTADRAGYRSGYYDRKLITRVGVLELRVPQDRAGHFSTELFERYQRSEKALVSALAEMYVQGVSTRKVKAITEELCGHSFSATTISEATARLDEKASAFSSAGAAGEPYPYLIVATPATERVREGGVIAQPCGAGGDRRRLEWPARVLGVEVANRESRWSSWREFMGRASERVACMGWSTWSATITPASRRLSGRSCLRPPSAGQCPLPEERPRLPAAQTRRRLDGAALVLRPAGHLRKSGATSPSGSPSGEGKITPSWWTWWRRKRRGDGSPTIGCRGPTPSA